MEEPKRVQFTTIETNQNEEKKASPRKTFRFNLDLSDTTDTACPEFYFNELLKTASGENRSSDDPFGDDDDADRLAAIARSFEEKYKPKMGKKKKNKEFLEDLVDLGDGYDENDTFIDNSEAYDEIVPATLTTKHGGFYINSGRLDFREISDDSDNDFQHTPGSAVMKKRKKRRISSDDDESGQENKKVVKKKKIKDSLAIDGEVKKKKKKKLVLQDGEKPAKKPNLTQDKDKAKSNKPSAVSALLKSTSPQQNGENLQNGILSPVELDDSEDSIPKTTDTAEVGRDDSNSQAEFEDSKKEIDPEKIPKLPPGLPAELEKTIESLKNSAKESRDGKCKFFTGNVNKLLLDVEMASLQLTCGNRSSMYAHLAAHLPCSKDTLLKRAKTLRVKEMDDKIRGPLQRLKDAVNKAMPPLQQKFDADFKAAQEKASQEKATQEKSEDNKEGPGEKGKTGDNDNEEEKANQADPAKKKFIGPVKRFVWDDNIRALLCDVVKVKMEIYDVSKARAQTAEEYLRTFLQKEIQPIWPKGWMQQRILIKESRPAHMKWTSGQKPKKNVIVTKTPGSAPTISHVTKTTNQSSAPAAVTGSKIVINGSNKNTPKVIDSARQLENVNVHNTPVISVRKITPTLLDYTNESAGKTSATNIPNSANIVNTGVSSENSLKTAMAGVNSVSAGKAADPKPAQTKPLLESWNHPVADILRQSVVNPVTNQSPMQAQFQRQNSVENSYLAQFQNFTASAYQHNANKLPSPNESSHGQGSGQQQKPGQVKQVSNHSPPKAHSQSQMTAAQQQKFLKETQERNIQRLLEQQIEQKKKLAAQQLAKMLNSAKNSTRNPDSNSVNVNSNSASVNKGNMGQRLGAGDSGVKQNKNVSLFTENVIRQQLDKQATNVPSGVKTNVQGHSAVGRFTSPIALAEQLRKTSPQSVLKTSPQSTTLSGVSQVKQQVVRVAKTQGQGQSHSNPTSGQALSATNLMQSLFGQAQAKSNLSASYQSNSSNNASVQQRSHQPLSGSSQPAQIISPSWNTSSMPSGFNGNTDNQRRVSFDGQKDGSCSQYLGPSISTHSVPGFPTAKPSTHSGTPGQPHRSPESSLFSNQRIPDTQ